MMLKFITSKMKVQPCTVTFLLIVIFSEVGADQKLSQADDAVPDEYILTGTVMDNESALKALEREAMLTYQLNLPKYLEQIPKKIGKPSTASKDDFDDRDFATVGSLATLDASIVFGEGLKNLRLISTQHAAGFPGRPRPLNDQIHNRVQRLNAIRNLIWLLKEKLRSGVVTADAPLMEKLREVQTWLSTQTGGHLGQAVTKAFEGSGLMAKLEAKWGATSLKFRAFSAVAANGLDFGINGFNTVVNSMALNQEVTDANILALTSSVSAMAGDVTMAVTQILTASAKAASVAGPIGYGIAATLYIASYATGVASGLVSVENLESKDYVKAFLSPLLPVADFGAIVDIIDAAKKGDIVTAYQIFFTRTVGSSLTVAGMAVIDKLTGSSHLQEYHKFVKGLAILQTEIQNDKDNENFKQQVKESMKEFVQKLKPKQFLYAFPIYLTKNAWSVKGWRHSDTLKEDFEISSKLTDRIVFMATNNDKFLKPYMYPGEWNKRTTFVPAEVEHGDDPFLYIGSNEINDDVILDSNTEAYGLGGNDTFYVAPSWGWNKPGTVKIDGGEGSDTIYTLQKYESPEGIECIVTGGGPEKDYIRGGIGNDFIYVENDEVSDEGGENTFVVTGSGTDSITVAGGINVIAIDKTSGSIKVEPRSGPGNTRIVYQGDALTAEGTLSSDKVILCGSNANHDVLSMIKYHPISLPSSPLKRMLVLLHHFIYVGTQHFNTAKYYFDQIDDDADDLFKNTRCTRSTDTDTPIFCPEAEKSQHIFYRNIERFELSRDTINLFLLEARSTSQTKVTHEIIGGPLDDYIVNAGANIPLMAQMSTGANRIYSRDGDDSYSLILDEHKDIIYDTGGHNLVAIMFPEGLSFSEVYIGPNPEDDSFLVFYKKDPWTTRKEVRLKFRFREKDDSWNSVRFLFKESTGKEVVLKELSKPANRARKICVPLIPRMVEEFYADFNREITTCARLMVESVTPAKKSQK